MAGPIALDAIVTGIKLMELCPIPALQAIAKTLISIWEAVQLVGVRLTPIFFVSSFLITMRLLFFFGQMNRLAVLRVTQMCTTILSAVHDEYARGGHVEDLEGPVAKLER